MRSYPTSILLAFKCRVSRPSKENRGGYRAARDRLRQLQELHIPAIRLKHIGLAGDLPGRVHGEYAHAAVDHVHAVRRQDVGDGAAATCVHLAEFGRLEAHAALVHDAADGGYVLGIGVVGTGLAARPGELDEREAVSQVARVLGLKDARERGVKAGGHIA